MNEKNKFWQWLKINAVQLLVLGSTSMLTIIQFSYISKYEANLNKVNSQLATFNLVDNQLKLLERLYQRVDSDVHVSKIEFHPDENHSHISLQLVLSNKSAVPLELKIETIQLAFKDKINNKNKAQLGNKELLNNKDLITQGSTIGKLLEFTIPTKLVENDEIVLQIDYETKIHDVFHEAVLAKLTSSESSQNIISWEEIFTNYHSLRHKISINDEVNSFFKKCFDNNCEDTITRTVSFSR
ncbi:hypothetical protein [Pseudoalteromonas spongiae]|uniref:hypothetical protein n=1 Tax=Pseudoalteromonas spongiae TaxID=298657 RepID=UPI000C2CE672|nr:hypothetical protein [Pseudoalteromonas spongiae]